MDIIFPNEAKLEYGVYVPLVKETPVVWDSLELAEEYARGHGIPYTEILARTVTAWAEVPFEMIGQANAEIREGLEAHRG